MKKGETLNKRFNLGLIKLLTIEAFMYNALKKYGIA